MAVSLKEAMNWSRPYPSAILLQAVCEKQPSILTQRREVAKFNCFAIFLCVSAPLREILLMNMSRASKKEARFPPRRNRARCCFENQACSAQL
jgi:hypothetical protein